MLEGHELVHYFHDNSDVSRQWQRGQTITTDATGPGCIIQSDFRGGDHGNFEVVVPQGDQLVHYFHDNSNVNRPWQRGQTVTARIGGPACIIQSDFRGGGHGNFEVVAPIDGRLQHFFHDNSDVNLPWRPAQVITRGSMYVFFTTDHVSDPGTTNDSMGRSVLARSEDGGIHFGPPLYDSSRDKFINVSLQVVDNATFQGCRIVKAGHASVGKRRLPAKQRLPGVFAACEDRRSLGVSVLRRPRTKRPATLVAERSVG